METIDVESIETAPRERWRPPPWRARQWRWMVGVLAVVGGTLALDAWGPAASDASGEDSAVDAAPAAGLTARQESMILHHFWLDELEIAACMRERGFDYRPDPDSDADQLAIVGGALGIDPAGGAGPLPAVLNARALQGLDAAGAQEWAEAVGDRVADGGCDPAPQLLYIDNEEALDAALAAARADEAFVAFVAQALILEGDPVAQLRAAVLVDGNAAPGPAPQTWTAAGDRIVAAVNASQVWIVSERLGTDAFVDLVGLTGQGEALMVRVAADPQALLPVEGPATGPILECGDHLVQTALLPSADPERDDAVAHLVLDAIAAQGCASSVLREGSSAVE
ncbi:hypothetical protein [Demequina activiva]|uniref:Uncharacterized protein n=1 Tax=Demequina activiva TaxID=1582364 RepID=A0A919UKM9_9MICO|nr:hypothetical protein [Demequina activiva]GIG55150.1 hypothetical protein Dac01nite_19020 [Demequina activiva]